MIVLLLVSAAVVLALLRGGRIGNLVSLNIRWRGVFLAAFAIQLLIFTPPWQDRPELVSSTQAAYLLSLGLLLMAFVMNLRLPGLWMVAVGFLLNSITIAVNGGYMPASPAALSISGHAELLPGQVSNNSIGIGPETRLASLSDIFAIPQPIIFANVFSVGDVLITLGAMYLVYRATLVSPAVPLHAIPQGTEQASKNPSAADDKA